MSDQLTPTEFLDQYEAAAKERAVSTAFDPTKGLTQIGDDPANTPRTGERKFDPEQGIEVAGEKEETKLDTGALLLSLDYGGDKASADEKYCAISFLEGRVGIDEIDDTLAPHMIAAISHTLFNQKNDFDGVLISNALKFYDAADNKYADGYNKDTKRWDSKTLLTHVKTAWDIIRDETGKKRRDVLNADLKAHGIDGRDFFSTETSQRQLDYMYNIAKQRVGRWSRFEAWDNAQAAQMVSGNGISFGVDGWFGLKSVPKALWEEGSRAAKMGWAVMTSDGRDDILTALHENTTWHYALESVFDGEFDNSDKFIIGMVAKHYGLEPDDYKGVYQKISERRGGMVRLVSGGETQAVLAVPRGLAPTHLKTNFLIDSGNEIYRKLNVIERFKKDYYDTLGVTRLADAIGILGSDPKAAEGVAIYTSKRKDSTDLLGFISRNEGDSDGLRNWANEYLAGAKDAKDKAERFRTVQTAFYTIQGLMNHPSGVLPESTSWWSEWGAGGANIALNFGSNVSGFLTGTGSQVAYKVERWMDGSGGEAKEAAEKAHREHMISQQVRNIAAWDVHNEGSIAGWLGDQIVGFKAFEFIFAARASSMLKKVPTKWAKKASKWLAKSPRGARAKSIESHSDDILKTADDIENAANELMKRGAIAPLEDNLALASKSLDMAEKAEALAVAAHKGVNRMKSLIGSQRSAQILDYWRSVLDRTPGLFMIHESSVDDMERSAASKYAEMMVGNETGYDDEMWTTAQDIIQGRAVVSTGFMMNLGEFFKKLKANAIAGGADATVAKNLAKIESDIIKAAKNPSLPESVKTIKAHILGMKVAFGEGVLREARSLGRLGFGIGSTNSLGEDIQDAAVGVKDWGDVGNDALRHGVEEGGAMGVTLAFMRSFKGTRQSLELSRRNVIAMKTIAQSQRPENIISSILARSKEAKEMTPDAKDMTRDEGISRFEARLGEYFDIMADANETSRNANLEKWRGENRELCGEEGAKMFDAFVRDLKYAPQVIDWRLENLGQRLTPKDLENTLRAGGLDAKAEQLKDGDVVVDVAFDFGGTKIGTKLLVHGGTIFVHDGTKFKESFALDVSKNIAEGKASKGLIEKYNALTDKQKIDLESGTDVNGILTDAQREMQSRGLFFSKEDAIKGKESGEQNLVNIESPELYNGIVFLANGAGERASIGDVRHEIIGHAVLDALRKAGAITPQQIEALKAHFGGDAKWEERFVDATVKAIAAGDVNLVKDLLPEQRTAITRIRDAARGVLKAMHLIKEKRGPEANFNVDTFLHETLERANETLKLQAERKHMESLVRANREAALEQARLEAQARRRELEKTLMEERRRNSELGHERAVRIAKSRDEMVSVEETIAKIADSAKSLDDFLGKVEKSKGEFIKKLKRLGFDKGEVGKFIEDWYLGRMDAYGDRLIERLETERVAAEAKAAADRLAAENKAWREAARKQWDATEKKLAEEEARKAKAEYKARLDAERQRIQAKAESKKQGEKFAKELSRVVQVAEQLGLEILDRLRSAKSVKQFDKSNKSALKEFDRLTKGIASDIVKPHRDNFKRELYDARKKMELKADAMKAREAENKRIEEERKAKEKEARAKQKEAERKANEKKAEVAKKRAEEKKALEGTIKEATIRVERELKAITAKQKKEQRDAELSLNGIELMAKGQPVPNKCVIAGLKGEQLERKRAFMRQSGYYYDKTTDCWVNKSTAPKAFKRASAAEVGKVVNNIVNAKAIAKLKGKPEAFAEFMVGVLNGVNGDAGEVSGGSDTSKKTVDNKTSTKKGKKDKKTETKSKESKVQGEARPLTEEDRRSLEAFEVMSAFVREQAAVNGWSKDVLEQKLRELAKLKLEIDPETNQIRIKGEQSSAEKPTDEAGKPSEPSVPSIPENKTLREEKKWWTKQLTAEERLGLAVIEVLGKPWGVAYCAGEVIQGGENIRIAGNPLPEGAVVRPFSVAAAEKALEAMADRKINGGVIDAEMRTKPFFDAEWTIAEKKMRLEKREANAKAKADAEKAEAERAALDEITNLQNEVLRLQRESSEIENSIVEKKRTVEDLQKLNPQELISLKPEYTKEEAASRMASIAKEISEIEAKLAVKTAPTHADGVDKGKEIAAEVKANTPKQEQDKFVDDFGKFGDFKDKVSMAVDLGKTEDGYRVSIQLNSKYMFNPKDVGNPAGGDVRRYETFKNVTQAKKAIENAVEVKEGETGSDGKMMVAYRQGVERLFMREFDVIQDKAKSLVDEMMEGFLLGPAYDAAVSYVNENEAFNRRSAIPNWLINERIELAHDPKGFRVKLDSGFTFFIRKGGFGGDNLYKMGKAVEDKDVNGLHAEVQIEFADGKAKMPYDFKAKVEADEARVLNEKNAVREENDRMRKELSEKGVSDTMLNKLEKVGAFKKSDAKFDVSYTVADFFPDSKTLAEIYPDTYQNTYIYIKGSEAAKALKDEKGKQIPEPLFAKGQFASLDTQGNIIVDMSTPEKRVRAGEDKFENAVLRDITACVVKKIRREEGLNDDTARSAEYLANILGVKGRDKKTGASTKFAIYEDKTLTDILHQAIRRRFTKREKVGFKVAEEDIKRVTEKCSEELNKILNDCFADFVSEREAIMFANRFGMSNSELSRSFGGAQRQAHEGAIISPFDKRFTTRQKSDTYAQYYRQVLRKIDEMVSVGAKDHKSRSLVNEFDELLNEFLRYEYRKNASSRGGEIFSVSPELKLILNLDGSGMKMADKTGSQGVGDGKFEKVVVDTAASPAEQVARAEEVATLNRQKAVAKVENTVDANGITASQKKAIADLESKLDTLFKQFASGKKVADAQKKLVALMPELTKLIKDLNPKISDAKVASLMKEAQTYFAFRVQGSPFMRDKKDGSGKEETPFGSVVTDGRMSVRGVDYEQGLIASYAAKIAWEKARRRGADISDIADGITSSIEAELRAMGVPSADAKTVSLSISADAKVVAENIIKDVDATVTEAQIISAAKSKAARHAIGNKIYRSFRRGYKVGSDGVEAHDRAERIVERQRMRAMRRAVGYTLGELNSALGINLISDISNIGRDGFKYGTAKDLAVDFTKRVVDAFRNDNYEMRNATDGEIMADPVFRAEYAATVSSWLVEAAKALSYGRERELAIRDAMRIRVTMPPTLRELQRTVEHHAEMLGKDLGKMSVEKTLDEIDKLIDNRPKFNADGEVEAGAAGASRVSEATRVYRRGIEPRLQEYWKFVKEAMRFNGEKVASEIERISTLLEASETELITIKNTAPSELKAEKLEDKDVLKRKLSALMRYGGLIEKSAGEVLDVYQNDIARDIAFAAERFFLERKRREEENHSIASDFINDIDTLLKDKKGYEDLSKIGKVSRRYFMWNIPDMFLKYNAYFKSDSKSSAHLTRLRQDISLAHEEHMRFSSIRQGEMLKAVEEVYGMPFADFVQTACVPDPKFSRFSRSSWVIPEKDGPTVEYWTGKYYQHDMPSIGKKKGDRITETLRLAVPKGDPRHDDRTKTETPLSLANLIYIYAACRQRDMEKNSIIFGRDAAYMRDLENTIGTKGIAIADRIVSLYDKMREDISPVSEYITGMPVLSPDRFYIPLVFAHDKSSDRITRYSVNPVPKFLTTRKFHDGASLKEDTNIFELTTRRIQDAYHYKAFGILADNTKEQLANSKVVSMYHKLLGDSSAKSLYNQLNETFNGGTAIDHQGGVGIRNFITATALGFSPTSSLKQLEGIGGWGLGMKPTEWVKMVLWDKWFNPEARSAIDMLHRTGFFETKKGLFGGDVSQRAEGFSEPMLLLMNARENGGTTKAMSAYTKAKEWYKGHMLDFMKFFDRISTDFGAGTYYASRKNFYKNTQRMTEADAHRAALADTDYMIQISQASGRPEFMNDWQRGGTSGKFLTHFVGPTLVRAGVEIEMLHRHFMVDRSRKSFNALASKLFSAHVICPAILTGVTQLANYFFGERDDNNAKIWDDFAENLAVSMLLGPLSGVLIIGQIAEGGMRKIANKDSTNKGWRRRYEIPLTSKLNSLSDSLINIGSDTRSIVDSVLDGAEITPTMVKNIREDAVTLLKQVFPMMRFINLGRNLYNDFSEKPKKTWASPE